MYYEIDIVIELYMGTNSRNRKKQNNNNREQ